MKESESEIFETPWTAACQAPLSMGFSRQQYWSGLPFHHHEGRLSELNSYRTEHVLTYAQHPEYDKTTNWVTGSGTSGPQTRDFLRRYFTTGDLINGWDGNAAFLSLQKAKLIWVGVSDASKKASHAFVIDGFAYWRPQTRYLVKNFDFYFRANMGWAGSYDGFYLVNKDMSISFEAGGYELNTGFNMICDIIL